jgi:hypothetical protein
MGLIHAERVLINKEFTIRAVRKDGRKRSTSPSNV